MGWFRPTHFGNSGVEDGNSSQVGQGKIHHQSLPRCIPSLGVTVLFSQANAAGRWFLGALGHDLLLYDAVPQRILSVHESLERRTE